VKKRGLIRLSIAIVIVVILFSYLKFAWPGFGGNSKPANLQDILDRISIRQDELGQMEPGSGSIAKKEKDKVSFTSTIDLGKDDIVTIRTLFNTTSDTVNNVERLKLPVLLSVPDLLLQNFAP